MYSASKSTGGHADHHQFWSGANVAAAAYRTRMEPGGGRCGGGGAGCVGGDLCSLGVQPQAVRVCVLCICVHDLDVDIYTAIRRGHA